MSLKRPLLVLVVASAAFVALGCSAAASKTYPLTGTVTLDGQPIPEGSLDFLIPNEKRGPIASAKIKDGKYEAHLPEGNWRVQINATREGKIIDTHKNKPERESYIPARYNSKSALTVEVAPTKENHHDFALQTKG
jgi:hypothetical protein